MKRLALTLFVIGLCSNSIQAQFSIQTGTNEGYEWNIFRNPEQLIQRSDTLQRADLWSNSAYNELFLNTDYLHKWENGRLKFSGDVNGNFYHQQQSAHKTEFRLLASYRTNYADNKYFEIAPEIRRRRQDGIDQNDLVFRNRLSFIQYSLPLHFDFYLKNKTWLKLETGIRQKTYDRFGGEETDYFALEGEIQFKKKWERKIRTEFRLQGNFSQRNQTEVDLPTETQPSEVNERTFEQYDGEMALTFSSLKGAFEIEFPVRYRMLIDRPTDRLNYQQADAGVSTSFNLGKVELSQSFIGSIRNFQNFTIDNNQLLNYRFIRSTTSLNIPLYRGIEYTARASFFRRFSNRDSMSSSAYRGFMNSYLETGIRFRL